MGLPRHAMVHEVTTFAVARERYEITARIACSTCGLVLRLEQRAYCSMTRCLRNNPLGLSKAPQSAENGGEARLWCGCVRGA